MSTKIPETAMSLFEHFDVLDTASDSAAGTLDPTLGFQAATPPRAQVSPGSASKHVQLEETRPEAATPTSTHAPPTLTSSNTKELSVAAAAAPEGGDTAPMVASRGCLGAVSVPNVSTPMLRADKGAHDRPAGSDAIGSVVGGAGRIGRIEPVEAIAASAPAPLTDAEREAEIRQIRKARHDAKMAAKSVKKLVAHKASVLAAQAASGALRLSR